MSAARMMRVAVVVAFACVQAGCFTTWATLRVAGYPGAVEENVREERVPMPGIRETLVVNLPLSTVTPTSFAFECKVDQAGTDAVYRAAYRYGSRWKKSTAMMFVLEAALGSVLLLATPRDDENYLLNMAGGVFLAADAVGTGALFFAPRKELYARTEVPVTTRVRSACPDGVMIELGGDALPLDAAGRVGDVGAAMFDEWMANPSGSLVVTFEGRSALVNVTDVDRCMWRQHRAATPLAEPPCGTLPSVLAARIEVPAGTLSRVTQAP